MTMDRWNSRSLFSNDDAPDATPVDGAPLAERMRPRALSEFVGQTHLVGEGRILRKLLSSGGALPSLILWGAPGTGKTTLARLLAENSGLRFIALSAVFSGVKDLREAIQQAKTEQNYGKRTVLFIDEIHRFNKAQQDALLHAVENGTVTLIGATTENPSFEVTGALLSRCRVLVLNQLSEAEIKVVLERALTNEERGLANYHASISDQLLDRIAHAAGGDARVALTALDAAVESTAPDANGVRTVTEETVIEALGRAHYAYDKGGEEHYNLASALIKSLRNSDVDASLYWLARMIEGGADPIFSSVESMSSMSGSASSTSSRTRCMTTSAIPLGGRLRAPWKMTSFISPPRRCLTRCSPSTHAIASATLLLPQPFGPTIAVIPSPVKIISV